MAPFLGQLICSSNHHSTGTQAPQHHIGLLRKAIPWVTTNLVRNHPTKISFNHHLLSTQTLFHGLQESLATLVVRHIRRTNGQISG